MTGMYHLPPRRPPVRRPPVRSFWSTGGGVALIISLSVVAAGCLCMGVGFIGAVTGPDSAPARRPDPVIVATTTATAAPASSSPSGGPSSVPPVVVATTKPVTPKTTKPASVYYASCAAAKAAGAAPLHRGDPGYRSGLDRDGDGTACEN